MSTTDASPPSDLQSLQIVWSALVGGVALATLVLGGLTLWGAGPAVTGYASLLFFANAAANIVAVVVAFAVQRRMLTRLPAKGTRAEVIAAVRSGGVVSLAPLEASALIACVAAFLTGQGINLLFVVPFFAFALLFFPTTPRVERLLEIARRG
jgi:hypothetical protein